MAGARGIRAGRAYVELFADNTKLIRGLRQASAKLKAFGATVTAVGMKLAAFGAIIGAPLAVATKVFASFDDQMRAVQAVTGSTGKQFDMLTAKAKLLGRTTSFTAAQVAGGMLELGRGGFDSSQIDAAIGSVLNLARATGTELSEATNIATGTLRSFGLAASDSGRVADVLAATANNSSQTLTDLGESMKYAAPVADAYGMTLEQTAKAIGALANFSIKGSMAGTTMKNIMLQLANPSIRKKIEALGVGVTDSAGDFRDVGSILTDLGSAMSNMPRPKRLAIMNELFGKRAVAGGIKLTTTNFKKLNDAIDNANGTAAKTAATMDAGIGGVMRRLWSALEGAAIAIGDSLAPALSELGDKVTEVMGWFTEWIEKNQGVIVSILKISGILIGVGIALILAGKFVALFGAALGVLKVILTSVGVVLGILKAALLLLVSPIGLVAIAFAAMGTYLLYSSGKGGEALDWLSRRFNALKDDALSAFGGISAALQAGDIGLAAKILWLGLKAVWKHGTNALYDVWLSFKHGFIKIAYGTFVTAAYLVESVWYGLEVAWIETTAFLKQAWYGFVGFFERGWLAMKTVATKTWNWIKSLFDDSIDLEAANKQIDVEYQAKLNEIDNEKDRKSAERELQRKQERDDAKSTHDTVMNDLTKIYTDKAQELDKQRAKEDEAADKELADARAELKEAVDAAHKNLADKRKRDEDALPTAQDAPESVADAVAKALAGAGDGLNDLKQSVVGTFSAAAVSLMGGDNTATRTATATEATAKNTRAILDGVMDGYLFGT